MKRGIEYAEKHNVEPLKKFVGPYARNTKADATVDRERITLVHLFLVAVLSFIIGGAAAISFISQDALGKIQRKQYRV